MVLFVAIVLDLVFGGYFVVYRVFVEHLVLFWMFNFIVVLWVQNILKYLESDRVHGYLDFWLYMDNNYDTSLYLGLL